MPVDTTKNAARPETAALTKAIASPPAARRFHFRATTIADQVRDDIVARIDAGEWMPGRAMPSEGNLADEYGIAGLTMRGLLNAMEAEGLLERAAGRGTFVREHPSWEEMAKRARLLVAAVGAVRPTDEAAHRTIVTGHQELTEEDFLAIARQATEMAGWLNRRARLDRIEAEAVAELKQAAREMRQGTKGAAGTTAKAGGSKAGRAA